MYLNNQDKDYIITLLNNRYHKILEYTNSLDQEDRESYFDGNIEWSLLCDLLSQFENGLSKKEIKAIYHSN